VDLTTCPIEKWRRKGILNKMKIPDSLESGKFEQLLSSEVELWSTVKHLSGPKKFKRAFTHPK